MAAQEKWLKVEANLSGMRSASFAAYVLGSLLVAASPAHASSTPPGMPPLPDLLSTACTYMGSGLTGGPVQIQTDKHEDLMLYDVSLKFQCHPSDPVTDTQTQKNFSAAVQSYADQLIYENTAQTPGKCRVIASQGSTGRLTSKPDDPQSYLYFNDDLLVQYHASFECRHRASPHKTKIP